MAKRKRKPTKQHNKRLGPPEEGRKPSPFKVIQFAQLNGVSECSFISTAADSFGHVQLLPLDHLIFTDEKVPAPILAPGLQFAGTGARLLQGPHYAGWKRLGLVSLLGSQADATFIDSGRVLEAVHTQDVWMLFFDWQPRQSSAWEVLLATQEKLRPKNMSLLPHFILPLIFLTRMEDRIKSGLAARWLPHFDYSYRYSFSLITGLFARWILEKRSAAARRQYDLYAAHWGELSVENSMTPEQWEAVEMFERYFGAQLEAVCNAERWEAALIRVLDEVSAELWQAQPKPDNIHFKALLPLALWRPESPVPVETVIQAGPDRLGEVWLRT